MPEGDTIHRVVGRLRPILEGQRIERIDIARHLGPVPAAGELVEDVTAHGKHLIMRFSGGLALRCHLRMTGSWHAYQPGERWRRAPSRARIVIATTDWIVVCFDAPDVTVAADVQRDIAHLGPDLCAGDTDIEAAAGRFDRFVAPTTSIGVALLDQRVAAGIGNVYKSEVLHLEGVDPRRPVSEIPLGQRRSLLARASALLRANLGPGSRRTVPEGLAVYGREGLPCRRCLTLVERLRQGDDGPRSTWWCPGCQR